MLEKASGKLLIIGGNEDKYGDCTVLRKFIELAAGRKARIAVMTTATELPREVGDEYRLIFSDLGAETVRVLNIDNREEAGDRHLVDELEQSDGIFFTGGDQLRLTSILGGSAVDGAIRRAFRNGTIIAGTSAGASVMSHTMIVGGDSSDTPKKSALSMAHGMGLIDEVVIDQHFAQRGRINRLLAAVSQNPHVLGIGVDEDTALLVSPDGKCEIVGSQTVTILDGKNIMYSNISELKRLDPLAISNVVLHILAPGYGYDLRSRKPYIIHK